MVSKPQDKILTVRSALSCVNSILQGIFSSHGPRDECMMVIVECMMVIIECMMIIIMIRLFVFSRLGCTPHKGYKFFI